jgi:hypothetical protein
MKTVKPFKTVNAVLKALVKAGIEVNFKPQFDAALFHHTENGHVSFDIECDDWEGCITFATPCELWNNDNEPVTAGIQASLNTKKYGKDSDGLSFYANVTKSSVEFPFETVKPHHPDFTDVQKVLKGVTAYLLPQLEKMSLKLQKDL